MSQLNNFLLHYSKCCFRFPVFFSFLFISHRFVDPCTRKTLHVRVVLQIAVKPGSYKVGSPSIPWTPSLPNTHPTPDSHLQPDTIEWVTKERGATQLLSLLIRIEEEKWIAQYKIAFTDISSFQWIYDKYIVCQLCLPPSLIDILRSQW